MSRRKDSLWKCVAIYAFFLTCLVPATTTAMCIWCTDITSHNFVDCIYIQFSNSKIFEKTQLDAMKESMIAASSSIEKMNSTLIMEVMNGVMAGEMAALHRSRYLSSPQDSGAIHKYITDIVIGCYSHVSHVQQPDDFTETFNTTLFSLIKGTGKATPASVSNASGTNTYFTNSGINGPSNIFHDSHTVQSPPNYQQFVVPKLNPTNPGEATHTALTTDSRTNIHTADPGNKYDLTYRTQIGPEIMFYQNAPNRNAFSKTESFNGDTRNNNKLPDINSAARSSTAKLKSSEVASSTATTSASVTDGNVIRPVLIVDPPKPTNKDVFFECLFKILSQEVFKKIFSTDISNEKACSIVLQVLVRTLNYIHNGKYSQYSGEIAEACIVAIKSQPINCPIEKYGEIIAKCLMEQFYEKRLITDNCDAQATNIGIAILSLLASWKFHETLYQQMLLSKYYHYIFTADISISDAKLLATNLIIRCLTVDYGDNMANEVANECEKRFISIYHSSNSFDTAQIIAGSIAHMFHFYNIISPDTASQQAMNISSRMNSYFNQLIIEAQQQLHASSATSVSNAFENPGNSESSAASDGSVVSTITDSSSTSADSVSTVVNAFSQNSSPNNFNQRHLKPPLNYTPNLPQYQIQNGYPTKSGEAESAPLTTNSKTTTYTANPGPNGVLWHRNPTENIFNQKLTPNQYVFSNTEAFNVDRSNNKLPATNSPAISLTAKTGSTAVESSEVTSSTTASLSGTDGNVIRPVIMIDPPKHTTRNVFFECLFKVLSQEIFKQIFSTDISNDKACSILLQVLVEALNYIHNGRYSQYSSEIAEACIVAIKSQPDNCPIEKYGEIIAKCLMEQFYEKKLVTDNYDTQGTDIGIAILSLLTTWKFHETLYQQILISEYYQYIFAADISISDAKLLATNLIIRCLTADYGDNMANEVANECEKRFISIYHTSNSFDTAQIIAVSIASVFHFYNIISPYTASQQAINVSSRMNSCFNQLIIEAQHQQHASPATSVSTITEDPRSLASSQSSADSDGSATSNVSTASDGSATSNVSTASDGSVVSVDSAIFASSTGLKQQKNEKEATKSSTTSKASSLSVTSAPTGNSATSDDSVTSSSIASAYSETVVSSPEANYNKNKKLASKTSTGTSKTSTSDISVVSTPAGSSATLNQDDSVTSSSVASANSETAAFSTGSNHHAPTEPSTASVVSSVTGSVTSSTSTSITRPKHKKKAKKTSTGTSKTSALDISIVSASSVDLDSTTTSEASDNSETSTASAGSVSSEISKSLAASETADHSETSADSDSSSDSVVSTGLVTSADSETSVSTMEELYYKNIPNQEKPFRKTCSDSNERIKYLMKYSLLSISNGKFNYESLSRIISYLVKYMQNTNPDLCPQKILLRVLIETIIACTQLLVKVPSQYFNTVEIIRTDASCFKDLT